MRRLIQDLAAIMAALFMFVGFAQAADDEIKGLVQLGWDWGGEKIFTGTYINGPNFSIRANEGIIFDVGVSIPNMHTDSGGVLETQAMIGLKYVTAMGSNGKVSFTSFPLTLIEQYKWKSGFIIGAGLTYQLKPDLAGGGVLSVVQVRMDNALGLIGQIGYGNEMATIGLRYTKISYQPRLYTGKIQGDGFSIFTQLKF